MPPWNLVRGLVVLRQCNTPRLLISVEYVIGLTSLKKRGGGLKHMEAEQCPVKAYIALLIYMYFINCEIQRIAVFDSLC